MNYEEEYCFILPNYHMKSRKINDPVQVSGEGRDAKYKERVFKESNRQAPSPPADVIHTSTSLFTLFIKHSHCPDLPEILKECSTGLLDGPIIYIDNKGEEHLYWHIIGSFFPKYLPSQSNMSIYKPYIDIERSNLHEGRYINRRFQDKHLELDYDLGPEYCFYNYYDKQTTLTLNASVLDQIPLAQRLFFRLHAFPSEFLIHHSIKSIFESPQITLMSIAERNAVEWQTKNSYD